MDYVYKAMNKERPLTDLEQLQKFVSAFAKLPQPINPNNHDVKDMIDILDSQQYIYKLVEKCFGPLVQAEDIKSVKEDTGKCWMDKTDEEAMFLSHVPGQKSQAEEYTEAMWELLKPDSPFMKLLLYVSQPSPNFLNQLQTKWRTNGLEQKDEIGGDEGVSGGGDDGYSMEETPLMTEPHPIQLRILDSEAVSTWSLDASLDFSGQTEEKVPPLLLVPFWRPPLDRKLVGASTNGENVRACVPSSMMAYYLVRMMGYLSLRAGSHHQYLIKGGELQYNKPADPWRGAGRFSLESLLRVENIPTSLQDVMNGLNSVKNMVDLKWMWHQLEYAAMSRISPSVYSIEEPTLPPLFMKLFNSYLQYFAPPAQLMSSLISHKPYGDLQWNSHETAAGVLIHGSLQMWLKRGKKLSSEHKRSRTKDPETMMLHLFALPHLEAVWRQVSLVSPSEQNFDSELTAKLSSGQRGSPSSSSGGNRTSFHHQEKPSTAESRRRKNYQFSAVQKYGESSSVTYGLGGGSENLATTMVVDSQLFVYRQALATLRQVMLSIPHFAAHYNPHLRDMLNLWRSLLVDPKALGEGEGRAEGSSARGGGQRGPGGAGSLSDAFSSALLRRYEAYSNILDDFFAITINKFDIVNKADLDVLHALAKLFEIFAHKDTLEWLKTVSNQLAKDANGQTAAMLKGQLSLTWVEDDSTGDLDSYSGTQYLLPVLSEQMAERAFPTYQALKLRLKRCKTEGADGLGKSMRELFGQTVQALGDSVAYLEKVFPLLLEKEMTGGSRLGGGGGAGYGTGGRSATRGAFQQYGGSDDRANLELLPSDKQREAYLRGRALTSNKSQLLSNVQFCPGVTDGEEEGQTASVPRWNEAVAKRRPPLRSNEIPFLVALTTWLDHYLNMVLRLVYPSAFPKSCIPHCSKCRRYLEVDPSQVESEYCTEYPEQPAIWWCSYCTLGYSAASKGPLCDAKGTVVSKVRQHQRAASVGYRSRESRKEIPPRMCCRCRLLIPERATVTLEYAPNVFVCVSCLSAQPEFSTRALANKNYYALLLIAVALSYYWETVFTICYALVRTVFTIVITFLPIHKILAWLLSWLMFWK